MIYNPKWEYIPFYDRDSVYSNSIKMRQELWVKPTYEPGEVWGWYGGSNERVRIVRIFKTGQILVRLIEEMRYNLMNSTGKWVKVKNGDYEIYHVDRFGYASCGTPSLRIRIK